MLFDCKLLLVIYYVKFIHIMKCVLNKNLYCKKVYNINKNCYLYQVYKCKFMKWYLFLVQYSFINM